MPATFELRAAANADRDAVRALVFGVLADYGLKPDPGSTDVDLDDIEGSYANTGGVFDVLVDDSGRIVGSVGLFRLDAQRCEMRKMYLLPSCRGLGLGRRLAEHGLTRARELGFVRVELETASVLKEAVGLYESLGFKPFEPDHLSERCDQAYYLDLDSLVG